MLRRGRALHRSVRGGLHLSPDPGEHGGGLAPPPSAAPATPHAAIAAACADGLAARFPGAGIGLSGSVAEGRHTAASDVDLLVVDDAIARDHQAVFREQGIRVNVLCVHPARFAARIRGDAGRYAGIRLNFVLAARPLRDPRGHLSALQDEARAVLHARTERRGEILESLRARIAPLIAAAPGPDSERAMLDALPLLADALLLRRGQTARTKAESRPFDALAAADPGAHALVQAALRGDEDPAPLLARLYTRAFGTPS
ncbi:MAG TPA: nucleotidyltransferase domain-containing protein [Longimicrobium sp.]|nr:nucleotidyltransferase domain-containing protein [Longimicrobium sp.]